MYHWSISNVRYFKNKIFNFNKINENKIIINMQLIILYIIQIFCVLYKLLFFIFFYLFFYNKNMSYNFCYFSVTLFFI